MRPDAHLNVSDWTTATYAAHNEALRVAQEKFETERDRRYTEVNVEKEKALKIKEEADKAALALAREIQTYKDEKANELREQINSERGLYATKGDLAASVGKIEVTIKPLLEAITAAAGRGAGINQVWAALLGVVTLIVGLITIGTFLFLLLRPPTAQPIIVVPPVAAPTTTTTTTVPAAPMMPR